MRFGVSKGQAIRMSEDDIKRFNFLPVDAAGPGTGSEGHGSARQPRAAAAIAIATTTASPPCATRKRALPRAGVIQLGASAGAAPKRQRGKTDDCHVAT